MNHGERLEAIKQQLERQDEVLARAKEAINRLGPDVQIRIPVETLETLATTEVHPALVNGLRG